MKKHNISALNDPTARAEAVGEIADRGEMTPEVLEELLNDPYDVVRAEALDYATYKSVVIDRKKAAEFARKENEILVRGRLFLYLTSIGYHEEAYKIYPAESAIPTSYDRLWWTAASYIKNPQGRTLAKLLSYLFSDDYKLSGTALDLLDDLTSGEHRSVASQVLNALKLLPDLRITRSRSISERPPPRS